MARRKTKEERETKKPNQGASLRFEQRLWQTADAWRGENEAGEYADVPGFCRSATVEEIRKHGHVLTPGRYVGAEAQEDDGEPFEENMKRLTARLHEQFQESARLEKVVWENLKGLGMTS